MVCHRPLGWRRGRRGWSVGPSPLHAGEAHSPVARVILSQMSSLTKVIPLLGRGSERPGAGGCGVDGLVPAPGWDIGAGPFQSHNSAGLAEALAATHQSPTSLSHTPASSLPTEGGPGHPARAHVPLSVSRRRKQERGANTKNRCFKRLSL